MRYVVCGKLWDTFFVIEVTLVLDALFGCFYVLCASRNIQISLTEHLTVLCRSGSLLAATSWRCQRQNWAGIRGRDSSISLPHACGKRLWTFALASLGAGGKLGGAFGLCTTLYKRILFAGRSAWFELSVLFVGYFIRQNYVAAYSVGFDISRAGKDRVSQK